MSPSVDATQQNIVEIDANGYHVLIVAVVILSTITGCLLVIAIFTCFVQRTSPEPSTPGDVEKFQRRLLILPTRRSTVPPTRAPWTTASTLNRPSSGGTARDEIGVLHQQKRRSYLGCHRNPREVVLSPPPPAMTRDRLIRTENLTEHVKEKGPIVVPPVSLEQHSSMIRFQRMDDPNWAPADDAPPPIPVQVAFEREMAARAIYEADHPNSKRCYTHGPSAALGPLARKMASISGALSPQAA